MADTPRSFVSCDVMSKTPPSALDGPHAVDLVWLISAASSPVKVASGWARLRPRAVVKLRPDDADPSSSSPSASRSAPSATTSAYGNANPSVTWLHLPPRDEHAARGRAVRRRGTARPQAPRVRGLAEAPSERAWARLAARPSIARRLSGQGRLEALRAYRPQRTVSRPASASARDARRPTSASCAPSPRRCPDGRLTCTAYARARAGHPEWPTRNTLTTAFGSWERALAAAGLGSRASPWRRARKLARSAANGGWTPMLGSRHCSNGA